MWIVSHLLLFLQVTPLYDGSFVIRAVDLCLELTEQAQSQIHISGVSAIQLNVVDKVCFIYVFKTFPNSTKLMSAHQMQTLKDLSILKNSTF